MIKQPDLRLPDGRNTKVEIADTFMKRFIGLMGRKEGPYALLIKPCNAIHTCFMRFNLDLVFLDRDDRIVEIRRSLRPWRVTAVIKNAYSVLEFPSSLGLLDGLSVGMLLNL